MSVTKWVLEYLKSGGELTKHDSYYRVGCRNIEQRISDIRAMGYQVNTRKITHRDGKTVTQYYMGAAA